MTTTDELYKVLSGLNQTDVKIWNKTVDISGSLFTKIETDDAALEAKVSSAFGADGFAVIGKDGGITASTLKLGTDADTTLSASNTLATEAAVKQYITDYANEQGNALTGVTNGAAISSSIADKNATIGVVTDDTTIGADNNGLKSLIKLVKKGTAETGFAATYELVDASNTKIAGTDSINIPKDQFLSGAHYDAATEELVFDFVIGNGGDQETAAQVKVPVSGLVHEYVGSDAITVNYDGTTAAGDTSISLKLDTTAADGKYLRITSNGLNLSGITEDITAASNDATAGLTALSAALTGYLSGEAVKNQFAADDARLDTIEAALADYTGPNAVSGGFAADRSRLTALETKTNAAITSGHVVIGGADDTYVDGGKTLGTDSDTTLAGTNVLATEASVKGYVDDKVANSISGLTAGQFVLAKTANSVETTGLSAVTSIAADSTDTQIPTAKAVYTYVNDGFTSLQSQINGLITAIDGGTKYTPAP